jgi:hypothetical protein
MREMSSVTTEYESFMTFQNTGAIGDRFSFLQREIHFPGFLRLKMRENAGKDPEKAPVSPEILHMSAQFRPVL